MPNLDDFTALEFRLRIEPGVDECAVGRPMSTMRRHDNLGVPAQHAAVIDADVFVVGVADDVSGEYQVELFAGRLGAHAHRLGVGRWQNGVATISQLGEGATANKPRRLDLLHLSISGGLSTVVSGGSSENTLMGVGGRSCAQHQGGWTDLRIERPTACRG